MDIQNPEVLKSRSSKRHPKDFKLKVIHRVEELKSLPEGCKQFGIPPSTVRGWVRQYKEHGEDGLMSKSSRPHHQPKKTSQWIIDKIFNLKKKNPEMGSKALSSHLARFENVDLSSRTVGKIFKKNHLPDGDQGYAEQSYFVKGDKDKKLEQTIEKELGEWERFARPHPNDLWQMDILSFYIRNAHRVYLISALDDCSRMIVGWGLFKQQTADNVLDVLRSTLATHGAPKEILTDQGAQFKHWQGVTEFQRLLKKLDIEHIKARSHHPQTCGKIEAYHKTLHRELIDKEFFSSQEQAVERLHRYIEHYNYCRPHSALGGFTPADRYFEVIDALKKYLDENKLAKNETEERLTLGQPSRLYLIGKVLGEDIRIQEAGGRLSIHTNNRLLKEINLVTQLIPN